MALKMSILFFFQRSCQSGLNLELHQLGGVRRHVWVTMTSWAWNWRRNCILFTSVHATDTDVGIKVLTIIFRLIQSRMQAEKLLVPLLCNCTVLVARTKSENQSSAQLMTWRRSCILFTSVHATNTNVGIKVLTPIFSLEHLNYFLELKILFENTNST